jgi:hypothetical protein
MTSEYDGSVTYKLQISCFLWWVDVFDNNPEYSLEYLKELKEKYERKDSKKIYETVV